MMLERHNKSFTIYIILLVPVLLLPETIVSAQTHYLNLNHPEDIMFTKGDLNKTIDWYPESTEVLYWSITKNGIEISNGTWYSGKIIQPLDDLEIGSYVFTLSLHSDIIYFPPYTACIMLQDSDTVQVVVLELEGFQNQVPYFVWVILGSLGSIGIILFIIKKRVDIW